MFSCVFSIVTVTSACVLTCLLAALSHNNEHEPGHDTSAMHYLANGSVAGVGSACTETSVSAGEGCPPHLDSHLFILLFSSLFFSLRDQQFCSCLDKELTVLGVSQQSILG